MLGHILEYRVGGLNPFQVSFDQRHFHNACAIHRPHLTKRIVHAYRRPPADSAAAAAVATPIVAISACVKQIMAHQFHATNQRNLDAVAAHSGCFPIIMPSIGQRADPSALLDHISGLMLTGSPSNVHPDNYGDELAAPEITIDHQRDATTLPMIRAAVERGIPVFAICRGMQELNVALGGTLHQFVHLLPGKGDHRADRSKPPEQRGDLAHCRDAVWQWQASAHSGRGERDGEFAACASGR